MKKTLVKKHKKDELVTRKYLDDKLDVAKKDLKSNHSIKFIKWLAY